MSEEMAQAEPVETNEVEAPQEAPQEEVSNEPEETVEQQLERVRRERDSFKKKVSRQKAALKAANERQLQQPKAEAPKETAEPKPEDYETQEDFVNAIVEYRTEKATEAKIQEQQQQDLMIKQQTEAQERLALRNQQEAEFRELNPNYDDAAQEVNGFLELKGQTVPVMTQNAILEAVYDNNVAELINYFGENEGERLDELEALTHMSPVKIGREIERISQSLKSTKKETTKKPLPKPPTRVEGKSKGSKPINERSGKDILKWVNGG
jgi:hypothetical protein